MEDESSASFPHIVAVSGNLGSGKTTLAGQLASLLGWKVEPRRGYNASYIEDQLRSPERWTFEAQLSFLTTKVGAIRSAVRANEPFLVDRSPYEDADVFARYWADRGVLDERGLATYNSFASLLLHQVPPPALILFCAATPATSAERLRTRPRPYQLLYPYDHIEKLYCLYEEWRTNFALSPIIVLDSERLDFRETSIVAQIADDIVIRLLATEPAEQLVLEMPGLPTPVPHSDLPARGSQHIRLRGAGRPLVYIAAAFSGREELLRGSEKDTSGQLWSMPDPHGVIKPGRYRRELLAIATAFDALGYDALLPHRDVNDWGRKVLTPQEATTACLNLVREADLFFGVLGSSYGSHAEAATAMALQIPSVIVSVGDDETFFGRGMRLSRRAISIKVESLAEIPKIVSRGDFLDHLVATIGRSW